MTQDLLSPCPAVSQQVRRGWLDKKLRGRSYRRCRQRNLEAVLPPCERGTELPDADMLHGPWCIMDPAANQSEAPQETTRVSVRPNHKSSQQRVVPRDLIWTKHTNWTSTPPPRRRGYGIESTLHSTASLTEGRKTVHQEIYASCQTVVDPLSPCRQSPNGLELVWTLLGHTAWS